MAGPKKHTERIAEKVVYGNARHCAPYNATGLRGTLYRVA